MPSPANKRATEPATPNMVISMRCLYRKIFRAVTLCVNDKRRQIKPIRSKKIFDPLTGGFDNKS